MTTNRRPSKNPMKISQRQFRMAAAAALLATLGACEQMDPASLIEKTRVIGARVEVEGAPDRATPAPKEAVTVTWLVVAPHERPAIGWAFAACPIRGGVPACDDPSQLLGTFSGHDEVPVIKLAIPPADQLGNATGILLVGRICSNSEPLVDAHGVPSCRGGADGTTATLTVPLQLGQGETQMQNHNPEMGSAPLWFDGQGWNAPQPSQPGQSAACADLPRVMAGSKDHVVRLGTAATDREWYTTMQGDPVVPVKKREALQISQFATAGKLDTAFSNVEAAASGDAPVVEIKWTAPEADKIPADGIVRFVFVARDLRGGSDWTTREVCVVK